MFVAFCILRPRHNLIYAPRMKYCDEEKRPVPLGRNPIHWIKLVLSIKEETIVEKLGLDAAIFLRFVCMIRNIFITLAVIGCAVAIPVNVIFNLRSPMNNSVTTASDILMLLTPIFVTGTPLIANIVLGYVFNGVVFFFLWWNFRKVVDIRRQVFSTDAYQTALYRRTLLITEIPKKYDSENGLPYLLERLKVSRPIQQISIGRNVKALSGIIEQYNDTILKLEATLSKYLKHPDKLPEKRPTCKPMAGDLSVYGQTKVDAIEYYNHRARDLEKQIEDMRAHIDRNNCLPYGFVSYNTPSDSNIVAKYLGSGSKIDVLAQLAPRPEDIIWKNIVLTKLERSNKQWWANLFYVCIVVVWIVPNAFIGCFLSQLSRLGVVWPAFQTFMSAHQTAFAIIQGFLAPSITTLVFMILPVILRRMSQWQGKLTKTQREKEVTLKLYIFFFFNNFFVFTLMSVAWYLGTEIYSIINKSADENAVYILNQLTQQSATSIISASSFWVMYVIRANIGMFLDLLQLITLVWNTFQRYVFSPTPRQLMLWTAPQSFEYATYYNWLLFYATIALAFTSIQPLVLPILALYLIMDGVLRKYELMYMFVTKTESDGSFWPLIHNCILFATAFGNLVLTVVTGTQGGWIYAVATAPLVITVIVFKVFTAKLFNDKFNYFIPSPYEVENKVVASNWETRSMLEEKYVNPAISKRLLVPMVHAKAQQALQLVISSNGLENGDFDYETNDNLPGKRFGRKRKNRRSVIAGGKFDFIAEEELDYDHYKELAEGDESKTELKSINNNNSSSNLMNKEYAFSETTELHTAQMADSNLSDANSYDRVQENDNHSLNPVYPYSNGHSHSSQHSLSGSFTNGIGMREEEINSSPYINGSQTNLEDDRTNLLPPRRMR